MTLPVLFIMISHHYPMTYGAERPWLVLALLGLTGVAVRHVFNLRGRGQPTGRDDRRWRSSLALASVTYVTLEKGRHADGAGRGTSPMPRSQPILATHCAGCHSVPDHRRRAAAGAARQLRACPRRRAADQGDGGR